LHKLRTPDAHDLHKTVQRLHMRICKAFRQFIRRLIEVETVSTHVSPHDPQHVPRTVAAQDPHTAAHSQRHTAQSIAARYPDITPSEVTIRTRWFEWLLKVAPEPLLRDKKGFTALASELFDDFVQKVKRDKMKSDDWVVDARSRYSQEWSSVGVIEAELVPDEVGGVLAIVSTQNNSLAMQNQELEAQALDFLEDLKSVSTDISEAELRQWASSGENRGLMRFKVEAVAEEKTYGRLRQQRLNQ
jgi:hypothetical protein